MRKYWFISPLLINETVLQALAVISESLRLVLQNSRRKMTQLKSHFISLFILVSLSGTKLAGAQTLLTDSLQVELTSMHDSLKPKALIQNGNALEESGNYDEALSQYFRALEQSSENENREWIFKSYFTIAESYNKQRRPDLAIEFAGKAMAVAEKQENKENLFSILDLIGGFIYFDQGILMSPMLQYLQKRMSIKLKSG